MLSARRLPPLNAATGLHGVISSSSCTSIATQGCPVAHRHPYHTRTPASPFPNWVLWKMAQEKRHPCKEREFCSFFPLTLRIWLSLHCRRALCHPIHCAGFSPLKSTHERVLHPTFPPSACAQHEHSQVCWRGQHGDVRHLCMHAQTEQPCTETGTSLWTWNHHEPRHRGDCQIQGWAQPAAHGYTGTKEH